MDLLESNIKQTPQDRELSDIIGQTLEVVTKDIYSLFIHPVKIIKKYAKGYGELFREYYKTFIDR